MQYDFDNEQISGSKNVVTDYLSRSVKNNMENNKNFNQQLIMTAGFHDFIIPDDADDKIIKVPNSLVGHSGLEQCLKRLTDSKQTWKYMCDHVRLNIDFVGPFPDGGYILIIDTFTSESADAQEAARCLFEHFGRFGAPSQILSDRGSYFVNHVIMELLSYVGTEHYLSMAYSKQENSLQN